MRKAASGSDSFVVTRRQAFACVAVLFATMLSLSAISHRLGHTSGFRAAQLSLSINSHLANTASAVGGPILETSRKSPVAGTGGPAVVRPRARCPSSPPIPFFFFPIPLRFPPITDSPNQPTVASAARGGPAGAQPRVRCPSPPPISHPFFPPFSPAFSPFRLSPLFDPNQPPVAGAGGPAGAQPRVRCSSFSSHPPVFPLIHPRPISAFPDSPQTSPLWPARVDLLVRSHVSDAYFLIEVLFRSPPSPHIPYFPPTSPLWPARVDLLVRSHVPLWPARVDLLVRSHVSDAYFLIEVLFRSIEQMWPRGIGDVILVLDEGEIVVRDLVPPWVKVYYETNYLDLPGKILQQWSYLWADNYTTAPYIAIIDDDVVFNLKVTPGLLFNLTEGKPIVIGSRNAQRNNWLPSTRWLVGQHAYFANFMVQLPFVFPRDVLPRFREHVGELHRDKFGKSFDKAFKYFAERGPKFERTQIAHTTLGNYMWAFTQDEVSRQGWDHVSRQGWDHVSRQGWDHVSRQGWDHVSRQGWDHVTRQGWDHVSRQGWDHVSRQGWDHVSRQGWDHVSRQGWDHVSRQGWDHVSRQGWDHVSRQGWDHVSRQGWDHVSRQGWDHVSRQGWDHVSRQGRDHNGPTTYPFPEWASTYQLFPEWASTYQLFPEWASTYQLFLEWASTYQLFPEWASTYQLFPEWASTYQLFPEWASTYQLFPEWASTYQLFLEWASTYQLFPEWASTYQLFPEWASTYQLFPEWASTYQLFPEWASTYQLFPEWASTYQLFPEWASTYPILFLIRRLPSLTHPNPHLCSPPSGALGARVDRPHTHSPRESAHTLLCFSCFLITLSASPHHLSPIRCTGL
ncbi:unnamed protein product [Closterium sp. NIES-65]|nr:unnamed protein product [Closterium sp. NIES-65]